MAAADIGEGPQVVYGACVHGPGRPHDTERAHSCFAIRDDRALQRAHVYFESIIDRDVAQPGASDPQYLGGLLYAAVRLARAVDRQPLGVTPDALLADVVSGSGRPR